MNLPKIGDIITTQHALELCQYFELDYLVKRINANPDSYKEWKFDGISCLPDKFAAAITGVDQGVLTRQCGLPHDLGYGYGEPGNKRERKCVDLKFKSDLMTKAKMGKFWASILYLAVRIGGIEKLGLSFTWAFAQKSKN